MSLYVDSSAILKRYVEEPDSATADALMRSDPSLLTARHTVVEVRRNLARVLHGQATRDTSRRAPGIADVYSLAKLYPR